jgi:hypothetical protein
MNDNSNQEKLLGILAAKLWLRNKMQIEKNGLSDETYLEVNDLIQKLKAKEDFDFILSNCLALIEAKGEKVLDEEFLLQLIRRNVV